MQIQVTVNPSFQKVGGALKGAELDKAIHDILTDFAFTTERYAKQVTPVDTGRLRASIGTGFLIASGIGRGGVARVAPHTDYAGFVHEGTRKMRARPFMKWGVEFAQAKFSGQNIANRLDDHLRRKLSTL